MLRRSQIRVFLVMTLAFVAGGVWSRAQAPRPQPSTAPMVLSGNDIGFRVDRVKGDTPIGTMVVRVNGQWVEVEQSVGPKRLTSSR